MTNNLNKLGILDGVPNAEYHAINAVNKSALDKIAKSPAHYLYSKKFPEPPTPAMQFGSALHDALLLPTEFSSRYAEAPSLDKRTKEGKALFEKFQTENAGKEIVRADDMEAIRGMVESVKAHKEAAAHLEAGQSELSCFWVEPTTELLCKCRPDLLLDGGTVVDIKTTQDASLGAFQKTIANLRYHVQAAWYLDGIRNFKAVDSFVFIAIEKEPPYACAVYMLDEAAIEAGRAAYRKDLATLYGCMKTEYWPGYPEEIQAISLPVWAWSTYE